MIWNQNSLNTQSEVRWLCVLPCLTLAAAALHRLHTDVHAKRELTSISPVLRAQRVCTSLFPASELLVNATQSKGTITSPDTFIVIGSIRVFVTTATVNIISTAFSFIVKCFHSSLRRHHACNMNSFHLQLSLH